MPNDLPVSSNQLAPGAEPVVPPSLMRQVSTAQPSEPATLYGKGDQELEICPVRDGVNMFVPEDAMLIGGSVVNDTGIAVQGQILNGSVIAQDGVLFIGPGAKVRGRGTGHRVHGRRVVIAGDVDVETVQADELLVIAPTARVQTRNLVYGRVSLRAGGNVNVAGGRFSQVDLAADATVADVAKKIISEISG